MILLMRPQMFGEMVYPLCKKCNLYLRRTGVAFMDPKITDHFLPSFQPYAHAYSSEKKP